MLLFSIKKIMTFDTKWYGTMAGLLKQQREILGDEITNTEYNILMERCSNASQQEKVYLQKALKPALNLSKAMALKQHIPIYRDEVKRQMHSLIINKEFNEETRKTLTKFFNTYCDEKKDYHIPR